MTAATVVPFTWSYSKLSLYEQCPAKYRFRYIEKISTPKAPAAARGTMIHQGVEDFLNGKAKTIPEEAAAFADIIKATKKTKPFVEHKIAITSAWEKVEWAAGWGRAVIDSSSVGKKAVAMDEWKSGKIYEDHADQRRLYLALAAIEWPDRDTYSITTQYFDQGKNIKLEITPDVVPTIVDEFQRRIDFLAHDDIMAPRPGWYCKYCDFSRYKGGKCKAG